MMINAGIAVRVTLGRQAQSGSRICRWIISAPQKPAEID
jgi:hypothetical protein